MTNIPCYYGKYSEKEPGMILSFVTSFGSLYVVVQKTDNTLTYEYYENVIIVGDHRESHEPWKECFYGS